ncbi:hypothetical protein HUC49_22525, partial [Escherichia coli]|nr:hypothetical protein [Escherichia coli]
MLRSMVEQLIMLVTDEAPDHDDHDGAASPSGDDHFSIWERELSEHDDDLPDDPALDRLFPSAA